MLSDGLAASIKLGLCHRTEMYPFQREDNRSWLSSREEGEGGQSMQLPWCGYQEVGPRGSSQSVATQCTP